MRQYLAALMILLVTSVSYGQTFPEISLDEMPPLKILGSDVASGNVGGIQEDIMAGAIIDRGTVQHFLDAAFDYRRFEIAYILLDALFNQKVDVVNCLFVTNQPDGQIVQMPPAESRDFLEKLMDDFYLNVEVSPLNPTQRVHMRHIKRLLLGQDFENLDSCQSISEDPHVGTIFLRSNDESK